MFNFIDIIVIAVIALSTFIGYKRGFVKTVISLLSFVIAIGIALAFYKPLAVILTEETGIDEWVKERIVSYDIAESGDAIADNIEVVQVDDNEKVENVGTKLDILNNLLTDLPDTIVSLTDIEGTKNAIKTQVADKVSELIMNLLSLIIIFVVVKVALFIANLLLDLATKIPGIKQVNEILGMVLRSRTRICRIILSICCYNIYFINCRYFICDRCN